MEGKPLGTRKVNHLRPNLIRISSDTIVAKRTGNFKDPIDQFLYYILRWDFLSSLNSSQPTLTNTVKDKKDESFRPPLPPPPPSNDSINLEESFKEIPVKFNSLQEYIDIWTPLSVAELRASVVTKFKSVPQRQAKTGLLKISLDSSMLYGPIDENKVMKMDMNFSNYHNDSER